MSDITEIVYVNITRETAAVDRAAFNIPMFLTNTTAFSERARSYTSLTAVAADFRSTAAAYLAAQAFFGQDTKPPSIVIGRRQVNSVTVSFTVTNSTLYTLTINGTAVNYTSDSSATAAEIASGLTTAFSATSISGITCTNNLNGTLTIGVSAAGTAWSIVATTNVTLANVTPTETWAEAITAVQTQNDTWYGLTVATRVQSEIEALAPVVEAMDKIYITASSDAAITTSATTDLGSTTHAAAYDRTAVLYSGVAATVYPECAWMGSQLPQTPGSNTWKFKTLSGVTVDRLTATQISNSKTKKANIYRTIGGQPITSEGTMASGEYIDIMIFVDWLKARMQERIYSRLKNLLKIPYTAAGLTIIENEIRAVLAEGINNGGLSASPAPRVVMPDVATIDVNLKALREVEGIKFYATLAGAIHKVSIEGTVSL